MPRDYSKSDWHYRKKILQSVTINQTTGCWEWMLATTDRGYGVMKMRNRQWRAHRLSHHLFVGEVLESDFVMHSCDNPRCVNPDHLKVGKPIDNSTDMVRKGRQYKKLTPEQVLQIRIDKRPSRIVAEDYGIKKTQVGMIRQGKRWTHLET